MDPQNWIGFHFGKLLGARLRPNIILLAQVIEWAKCFSHFKRKARPGPGLPDKQGSLNIANILQYFFE